MRRSLALLLVLAAALLLTTSAGAADPLTITSSTPSDGDFRPPTPTGGIPFQVVLAGVPADANVSVTIASSATTNADGLLPTDNRVDFFFLAQSGAAGSYLASSDPGPNAWSADLGTYFWQVQATWTDAAGVLHSAAGPVERLSIGTPPPGGTSPAPTGGRTRTTLAMSSVDAPYYVRQAIRRHTKRTATRLRFNCARLSSRSFRCRPTWRDSVGQYSATATISHSRRAGRIVATATVRGQRATRQCLRNGSLKSCRRAFRWQSVIAARPLGTR
jgi:hypothetical protein